MRKTPEIVAAVSAAIAEELGTSVSAIRIVSFREAGGRPIYQSQRGYTKYQLEDELR